jgi:hypothetical protein
MRMTGSMLNKVHVILISQLPFWFLNVNATASVIFDSLTHNALGHFVLDKISFKL